MAWQGGTERTRWTRSGSVTACSEKWEQNAVQSPRGESHKSWDVTLVTSGGHGIMASPLRYGRSARDITNVMQKLQGRCENAYSHCSTWVCSSFRGDSVPCTAQQKSPGLRHVSPADNWSNFFGILDVIVCGVWRVSEGNVCNGSYFGHHKHTVTFSVLNAVLSSTLRFCWLKFQIVGFAEGNDKASATIHFGGRRKGNPCSKWDKVCQCVRHSMNYLFLLSVYSPTLSIYFVVHPCVHARAE